MLGADRKLYRAEFVIEQDSPLVGKTLEEAGFANPVGYEWELDPQEYLMARIGLWRPL